MPLNEADTRAQLIDPQLKAAGWSDSLIAREHFYRRDHRHTASRIYLVGDEARRRAPGWVDYLPRYTDAFPIAVVEAKAFETREGAFLDRYREEAREVILALLDQYRIGGVEQLADPRVFRLSPFREMGQAPGVIQRFGGTEGLQDAPDEVQRRLYAA